MNDSLHNPSLNTASSAAFHAKEEQSDTLSPPAIGRGEESTCPSPPTVFCRGGRLGGGPVIDCRNLVKTYKDGGLYVEVLRNVNLTVRPGEQIAIVGTSGAGKSTLLQIMGGLDTPTDGQVFVNDKEINKLSERERSKLRNQALGFVYQFHHLLPEFTVLENVCMPLLIRKVKPEIAMAKARKLLDKVGLIPRERHKLAELSGGERQRTAIVRALVSDPACVLADEPTGNLDHKTAERVYETMLELNRELNTSIVTVTHDPRLGARMDRIYYLDKGELKEG